MFDKLAVLTLQKKLAGARFIAFLAKYGDRPVSEVDGPMVQEAAQLLNKTVTDEQACAVAEAVSQLDVDDIAEALRTPEFALKIASLVRGSFVQPTEKLSLF